MNEVVFEVTQDADGGLVAECLTEAIFTQAGGREELRANVKQAVAAFYFDKPAPPLAVRLHLVHDEVLASRSRSPTRLERARPAERALPELGMSCDPPGRQPRRIGNRRTISPAHSYPCP
ncbi:MAG: hypothetical protein ACRD10_15025 [Terriglobia bacterium]